MSIYTNIIVKNLLKFDSRGPFSPQPGPKDKPYHLYVHVPFCETLCPYCSFHRVPFNKDCANSYFNALRVEIRRYHELGFVFSDVYVGGGTPTIAPEELRRTLELIRSLFPVRDISVETNPTGLRDDVLGMLKDIGITRLSVGIQSFDDELLKKMARYDKYGGGEEIRNLLKSTQGIFQTLNVDMIFGFPGQPLDSLSRDIDILLDLGVDQVTFYPLMLSKSINKKIPDEDIKAGANRRRDYYRFILKTMQPSYNNSSAWCFSKKDGMIDEYIIKHDDYVGVGSGAFSYVQGVAFMTTFSIDEYMHKIELGGTGITRSKSLTLKQRMLYDSLVKLFGLKLDREYITRKYGMKFWIMMLPEILAMWGMGALRSDGRHICLTKRGMYLWVSKMAEFFKAVNMFRDLMRLEIHKENGNANDYKTNFVYQSHKI